MKVLLTTIASMFNPDERFIMRRYYSTRIAKILGIVLIVAWGNCELLVHDFVRLDLAIIAGAMAIAKILAMLYLRLS